MLDFIKENWRLIVDIISIIVVVVFFFIRKKPVKVYDCLKTLILDLLPTVIRYAEQTGTMSSEKKSLALLYLFEHLSNQGFGTTADLIDKYYDFAAEALEDILSTPQKKGVNYGKK